MKATLVRKVSSSTSIFEIRYPNSDIKGKVLGDNLGVGE